MKYRKLFMVLMIIFWVFTFISWVIPDGIPGEEFVLPIAAGIFTILYITKRQQLKKTAIKEMKYRKLVMVLMIIFWSLTLISWLIPDGIPGEEFILPIPAGIFTVLYLIRNKNRQKTSLPTIEKKEESYHTEDASLLDEKTKKVAIKRRGIEEYKKALINKFRKKRYKTKPEEKVKEERELKDKKEETEFEEKVKKAKILKEILEKAEKIMKDVKKKTKGKRLF